MPEKCRVESCSQSNIVDSNENLVNRALSIMCDINDDLFEFKVVSTTPLISGEKCEYLDDDVTTSGALNAIIFRWTGIDDSRQEI